MPAADDGAIVATQIGFASRACVVEVDRDAEPVVEIPFTIPFEDATLGIHEPPNSRRVQLFAFCRPPRPDEALPTWISLAEAEGARLASEAGVEPTMVRIPPLCTCTLVVTPVASSRPTLVTSTTRVPFWPRPRVPGFAGLKVPTAASWACCGMMVTLMASLMLCTVPSLASW